MIVVSRLPVAHAARVAVVHADRVEHVGFVAIAAVSVFHLEQLAWFIHLLLLLAGAGVLVSWRLKA
jgi:hypothetical protein